MGFLDKFKNEQQSNSFKNWKNLDGVGQLQGILADSQDKPIVLFKHSTRCGISVGAQSRLQDGWSYEDEIDFYYLDLLQHKDISAEMASLFKVVHQSPQIIVVYKGETVYHTSHHNISLKNLSDQVSKYIG